MSSWDRLLLARPVDAHVLEVLLQARCPLIDVEGFFLRAELDLIIDHFSSCKVFELKDDSFLYRPIKVQDLEQPVFSIAHFHVFQSQIALNDVQWQLPQLRIGGVYQCPILVDKSLILQSLYFLSVNPCLVRILLEVGLQSLPEALKEALCSHIGELLRLHFDLLDQIVDRVFISGHLLVQLGH